MIKIMIIILNKKIKKIHKNIQNLIKVINKVVWLIKINKYNQNKNKYKISFINKNILVIIKINKAIIDIHFNLNLLLI